MLLVGDGVNYMVHTGIPFFNKCVMQSILLLNEAYIK